MIASVTLHSKKLGEINKFLSMYYNTDLEIPNKLKWKKQYDNPVEITDLIGVYIDNLYNFDIKMWINLDRDIFINISERNANEIIRYLFERYPY